MYAIPEFDGPFRELIPQFIKYKRSLGYDYGRTIVYRLLAMNRFFLCNGIRKIEIPEDIYIRWINLKDDETRQTNKSDIRRYMVLQNFSFKTNIPIFTILRIRCIKKMILFRIFIPMMKFLKYSGLLIISQ